MKNYINFKLSVLLTFVFVGCGEESKNKTVPLSVNMESNKNVVLALGEYIEASTTGDVLSYQWKESEKLLSTNKTFNTQHLTAGEHNITLTVKNKEESKSDSLLLRVYSMLEERESNGISARLNHKYMVAFPTVVSQELKYLHTYSYSEGKMSQQVTKLEPTGAINTYNFNYDEDNRLIEISNTLLIRTYTYHTNNTIKSYTQGNDKYSYDDSNNLLTFHRKGHLLVEFTYDKNNNILSKKVDEQDNGSIDRTDTFSYDKNSNLLTHESDYNGGEERTYTYDEDGNKITSTYKSKEHETSATFIYNKENQLVNSKRYINNKLSSQKSYIYSDSGKKVSELIEKSAGSSIKIIKVYDDNKNLLKETIDGDDVSSFDGTADTTHTYTYDSKNNLLSSKLEDENKVLYEYTFINTYDEHKTLVKVEKNGIVQFEKRLKL